VFLPAHPGVRVLYSPRLLGAATLRFADRKLGIEQTREVILAGSIPDGMAGVEWQELRRVQLSDLEKSPANGAQFEEAPPSAVRSENYTAWQRDFVQALLATQCLQVFRCASLKATSKPNETEGEFRTRIAQALREKRDAAIEALRKKYAPRVASLQVRLARANAAVQTQKEQASQARMQTFISVGSTLLGAVLGRKGLSSATISKATTAARGVSRSIQENSEAAAAQEGAEAIRRQIADIETDIEAESAALAASQPDIEIVEVKPLKSAVCVRLIALGWIPSEEASPS
jgi:hypothetical protein